MKTVKEILESDRRTVSIWFANYYAKLYIDTANNSHKQYLYIDIMCSDSVFNNEFVDPNKGFSNTKTAEKYLVSSLRKLKKQITENLKKYKLEKHNQFIEDKLNGCKNPSR